MLVGRSQDSDYPEQALKVPPISEITEDTIEIFEPDLVLSAYGQHITAEKLLHFEPHSIEGMLAEIKHLGDLLGKQVESEMLIHEILVVMEKVKQKGERFRPLRVYCETQHNPPQAARGYLNDLVRLTGDVPYHGPVDLEELQRFDPQVIISCAPNEERFNFELLIAREGWESLNAVRYERLFSVDSSLLYRPGPRLIEGIRKLARLLHGIEAI